MTAASVQSELVPRIFAQKSTWIDRVVVLESAASTQDAARERCGGRPGLLLLALHQPGGRGRMGRKWVNTPGLGLAMTIVLPGDLDPGRLSITAGLAACMTCEAAISPDPPVTFHSGDPAATQLHDDAAAALTRRLGLRWPNDVVETDSPGRKLAGVLIERSRNLSLVGIGINVGHRPGDWPAPLADRAVSLAQLGSHFSIAQTAAGLARTLDRLLDTSDDSLRHGWSPRNVLRGSTRTFVHDGRSFTGLVREIEPTSHIELLDAQGRSVRLPALTTSLVHE